MKKNRFELVCVSLAAFFLTHPQPASATLVTAVICNNADFLCNQPGDVVIDSGFRANQVGVLGANRFTVLPFTFNDAIMNFTGSVVVADRAGKFIYSWGTGTATAIDTLGNGASGGIGRYLDVTISQNYVTTPGLWGFSEINIGDCSAVARANASTSLVQGAVNGGGLPVLGTIGDCAGAPFAFRSGPWNGVVGGVTNLTAAAQFYFAPGFAGNQSITLPWGDDFPDPTLNFNDPNNPDNFVTITDNAGFTEAAPEPGTFTLIGGTLCAVAFWLRRRSQ